MYNVNDKINGGSLGILTVTKVLKKENGEIKGALATNEYGATFLVKLVNETSYYVTRIAGPTGQEVEGNPDKVNGLFLKPVDNVYKIDTNRFPYLRQLAKLEVLGLKELNVFR